MRSVTSSISITEVLVIVLVFGSIVATGAVTVAKGHVALFVAGWLLGGLIWPIAALRLAKPNSAWARRFYGAEKLERSQRRYPDIEPSQRSNAGPVGAIGFGIIGVAFLAGLVDGLAS
jgi:hypothetical protein